MPDCNFNRAMQAAAEQRYCPLPEVNPTLCLPSAQQAYQLSSLSAAPSLPRPPAQVLPLRKIPPAFVLILAPLAQFWGQGISLPLSEDAVTNSADLQACEQMATAVLAAKRGKQTWKYQLQQCIKPCKKVESAH